MEDPATAAHEGCVKLQKCLTALKVTFPDRPKLAGFLDILTAGVVGHPDVERAVMARWHREMTTDASGRPREPTLYQELRNRNIPALLGSGSSVLEQLDAAGMFNDPRLTDTSRETLCRALDGVNRKAAAAAGVDIGPPPAATPALDLAAAIAGCAEGERRSAAAAPAAAASATPDVEDAASLRASVAAAGVRKLRECLHALSVAFPERAKLAAWLSMVDTAVVGNAEAEAALLSKWHAAMTTHPDGRRRQPDLYAAVAERRMADLFAAGVWLLDEVDAAAMFADAGLSDSSRERLCKGFDAVNARAAELAMLQAHPALADAAASTMAHLDAAQAVTPEASFAALQAMLSSEDSVKALMSTMTAVFQDKEVVEKALQVLGPATAGLATGQDPAATIAACVGELASNQDILRQLQARMAGGGGGGGME